MGSEAGWSEERLAAGEQYAVEWSGVEWSGSFSPILPVITPKSSLSSCQRTPCRRNHLLELLVLDLEAEGAHGSLELAGLDGARLVGESCVLSGGPSRPQELLSTPCAQHMCAQWIVCRMCRPGAKIYLKKRVMT